MSNQNIIQLNKNAPNPLWLSISEAAKLGGVQAKTIRRAIQSKSIKYKVVKNRYLVDFVSIVLYLHKNTKLKNKFYNFGIGQYFKSIKSENL
jgi:excisionase family DNA binding protein